MRQSLLSLRALSREAGDPDPDRIEETLPDLSLCLCHMEGLPTCNHLSGYNTITEEENEGWGRGDFLGLGIEVGEGRPCLARCFVLIRLLE